MRGEDKTRARGPVGTMGSPPHARGRLDSTVRDHGVRRITPACAGKTPSPVPVAGAFSDHPRMRGEDSESPCSCLERGGSPPHARGRLCIVADALYETRITPACAGKTLDAAVCT